MYIMGRGPPGPESQKPGFHILSCTCMVILLGLRLMERFKLMPCAYTRYASWINFPIQASVTWISTVSQWNH